MIPAPHLLLVLQTATWSAAPNLPVPVANNAVAANTSASSSYVYSFLGIGVAKTWSSITNAAYEWNTESSSWLTLPPVPGPGRLAGTAQSVGNRVYLFGGYTVAPDGAEKSVPNVDVWDVTTRTWARAADMPVPVDDAVSGVWNDSLVYLISGWHDTDNVANVQVFNPATNNWQQATPIEGTPVFGHTGGISGNTIVFIDGARRDGGRPRYTLARQAWRGDIDPQDATSITWREIEHPDTPPMYRSAAIGLGKWVIFAGGTDNPYNYNGIGYNGQPATPTNKVFAYNVLTEEWKTFPPLPAATMDHRGLVHAGGKLYLVGGMAANQAVSNRVFAAPIHRLLPN